jgi:hypothetical protein
MLRPGRKAYDEAYDEYFSIVTVFYSEMILDLLI